MSTPVIEKVNVITPVYEELERPTTAYEMLDELFPYEEPTDKKTKTHIVNPPKNLHIWQPGMETQEIVNIARAAGLEIEALCGYRFVPKHNPDKLDVCEDCMRIATEIMKELGE